MKCLCGILLAIVFIPQALFSQGDILSKFAFRSYSDQGITIPYRFFIPDSYRSEIYYPLILALHGSGERGTDNTSQLTANRMGVTWAEPASQSAHPCFVVVPQCPPGGDWSNAPMQNLLNHLMDSLAREFSVDTNRLYLTGLSMGGFGTWDMIGQYPHRFAAAIPMSAGANLSLIDSMKLIPIWNFHGAKDDAVPVAASRISMDALRNSGREVIYTHCRNNDCTGLPDSIIGMQVSSHAQVLYTEYQFGGHIIWNDAYDYPYLHAWLFDKYKQIPNSLVCSDFGHFRKVSGTTVIGWTGGAPSDSIEIWFSNDAGDRWSPVSLSAPNIGSYDWITGNSPDCPFGMLKFFLKNQNGHIYGSDRSRYISISNGISGTPFVKILNADEINGNRFEKDTIIISILAGSSDANSVFMSISYSTDAGVSFMNITDGHTPIVPTDTLGQSIAVPVGMLANSDRAVMSMTAMSGAGSYTALTHLFSKRSPRLPGTQVVHSAGAGGGTATVHILDPSQLSGHQYRISFETSVSGPTSYSVVDCVTGLTVVDHETAMDGITEGPLFDGIRLLVNNVSTSTVDQYASRWTMAGPKIVPIAPSLPRLVIRGQTVAGLPYPSSYRLTMYDHIVDTSRSAYSIFYPIPVNFSVWNITENRKAAFGFYDGDRNGIVSNFDDIYLLEPDSTGTLRLSWSMLFAGNDTTTLPEPGNEYELRILTPFTPQDTFEFYGIMNGIMSGEKPEKFDLHQNYPNPFNPSTTISYAVGKMSRVRIQVFDILGREITTLVNEIRPAGRYEVQWDGREKASGVYFYRINAGDYTNVRKMILLR